MENITFDFFSLWYIHVLRLKKQLVQFDNVQELMGNMLVCYYVKP